MLQNIALWLDENATVLGLVAMILLGYCQYSVFFKIPKRKLVRHVMIPFVLGSVLTLIALSTLLFFFKNLRLFDGIVLVLLTAHLPLIGYLMYQHRKEQRLRQDFLNYVLPTMRLLSRLFASGKLSSLDSKNPKAEDQALVRGVQKSFSRLLSNDPIWRLTSRNGVGQRPEILHLQIVIPPPPHLKTLNVMTMDYNVVLRYGADGAVLYVNLQPLRLSRGTLAQVPVEDDPSSTYWAIRSPASLT